MKPPASVNGINADDYGLSQPGEKKQEKKTPVVSLELPVPSWLLADD
jgi:hypothetical protein